MPERPTDQLAEELLRVFAEAPVGLCYFDTNLQFAYVNDRLAEINGVPVEEHPVRVGTSTRP